MFLICHAVSSRLLLSFLRVSTYVRWAIHQGADLVDSEVDHLDGGGAWFLPLRRGSFRTCEDEVELRLEGSLELLVECGLLWSAQGMRVLEDSSQDRG
jgi:hypothetical protein